MGTQDHRAPQGVLAHGRAHRLEPRHAVVDADALADVALVGGADDLDVPLLGDVHGQAVLFAFEAGDCRLQRRRHDVGANAGGNRSPADGTHGGGRHRTHVDGRILRQPLGDGLQRFPIRRCRIAEAEHRRLANPLHWRIHCREQRLRGLGTQCHKAVGCRPAHRFPFAGQRFSQKLGSAGSVVQRRQLVCRTNAHGFGAVVLGVQLLEQPPRLLAHSPARLRRFGLARLQPVQVVIPSLNGVVRRVGQGLLGHGVRAKPPPIARLRRRSAFRLGGAVQPEAPHEPGALLPCAPVVASVVAAVEQVVRVEHHAARLQRPDLELPHQRPAGADDGLAHAVVVPGGLLADVLGAVGGIWAAHRNALHAVQVVAEIQVVGAGEVVVVFLVVERPILRIGHRRGRPHVSAHFLWIVEHLYLHGMVVALLAGVEGAVVVLVPMLVVGTAGEGRVVREGHDGVVPAR